MNPAIDCGTVRGEIYLFLERELPEEQIRGIAAHIESCVRCREFRERVVDFQDALPEWNAPPPSNAFVEGVLARIAQHERTHRRMFRLQSLVWGVRGMLHTSLRVPLPVGLAAAALLVISVSLNFSLFGHSSKSPSLPPTDAPVVAGSDLIPPAVANGAFNVVGPHDLTLMTGDLQRIGEKVRSQTTRPPASER